MTDSKTQTSSANSATGQDMVQAPGPSEKDAGFGRLVFHSLCSAACAIVPVPFLDDHLVKLTRRRMVRELANSHHVDLNATELAVLSGTRSNPLGCGCFLGLAASFTLKVVFKIVRRIFRTVLFWLLIKDAADAASQTLHDGYLVQAVLDRYRERARGIDSEPQPATSGTSRPKQPTGPHQPAATAVDYLRVPVDGVLARVNTRALNHTFRGVLSGSRRLLIGLARTLSRLTGLREQADDGEASLERELEDAIPRSLIARVAKKLSLQGEYFRNLDELLAEQVYLYDNEQQHVNESYRSSASVE